MVLLFLMTLCLRRLPLKPWFGRQPFDYPDDWPEWDDPISVSGGHDPGTCGCNESGGSDSRGQDLFSANCASCHGEDGKATKIEGVAGLEGKEIPAINSTDVLYTFDDATLAGTIAHGRPVAGMTPFGKAYGGAFSTSDLDNIVTFMRYSWDDRFQLPPKP